ncbi:MAG: hypothetical protein R3E90_03570 [Marinicella sp.]|nr:hypothetical protein [Xanthomonadales bacterium]
MKRIILVMLLWALQVQAQEKWLDHITDQSKHKETTQRWHADGGQLNIMFFYGLLQDIGVKVKGTGDYSLENWEANSFIMPINNIGGLALKVPYGNLIDIDKGSLSLSGQFSWQFQGNTYEFKGLSLIASNNFKRQGDVVAFELVNDQGEVMLYMDHIHTQLDTKNSFLSLDNMDVSISPYLAEKLGQPELAGTVIAQAHAQTHLTTPLDGYVDINSLKGGSCASRPLWPGDPRPSDNQPAEADVALIDMSAQQQRNLGSGKVVITPSARLKNVGGLDDADVAWYTKFSGTFAPYGNAQHPFLVWNMYREIDGRFEQIGVSGVKHAFLTINSSCTVNCGNSHILWPGCEDVYGTGNNDSGGALGPREEIEAFKGTWVESPSFFDQDGNGSQDNSSNSTDENRMVVDTGNLGTPDTTYYISAWYVIRDDINIFNTMGYKQYATSVDVNGNAQLSQLSNLQTGPASDQYVTPDTFDLNAGTASQRILRAGEGHLTVAVKAVDLGGGLYRYNYMIENHDYDPQIQTISVPLHDTSTMTDFMFVDTDEFANNTWTVTRANNMLTLQAPAGNEIDWGILYSFSFTVNAAPVAGDVILTGLENGSDTFDSALIVPNVSDLIFENGFENMNPD